MEDGESTAEAGAAASANKTPVSETCEEIGSRDDSGDKCPAESPSSQAPQETPPTKTPKETLKEIPPAETLEEAPVSPAPAESPKPGAGSSSEGESLF